MKGRIAMQMTAKMPWKSEGVRHDQVEFIQLDVPRVIPAAISAPILNLPVNKNDQIDKPSKRTSRSY